VKIRIVKDNCSFVAEAKVLYCTVGMGLMFTNMEADRLEVLDRWLAQLSGESCSQAEMPERQSESQRRVFEHRAKLRSKRIDHCADAEARADGRRRQGEVEEVDGVKE
jgi:hypothetical protein